MSTPAQGDAATPLLAVRDLRVRFRTPQGTLTAVDGLDYTLAAGATLGLVGESGSGKSQSALALLGLSPGNARVEGSIRFEGRELVGLAEEEWRALRGDRIGMVFQDPMTSLNPYLRIGRQMAEVLTLHRGAGFEAALAESARMLDAVGVGDARRRLLQYPHELSGGLRQRVMIAMTLLCRPQLLIADEPTTALDVTVQAQLIELLGRLRRDFGLAILLITHDLGLVGELCDETLVVYAGRMMERGATARVLARPSHPYTAALLRARPRLDLPREAALAPIPGQPPDLARLGPGCAFRERCAYALPICAQESPDATLAPGRGTRWCHAETAAVLANG